MWNISWSNSTVVHLDTFQKYFPSLQHAKISSGFIQCSLPSSFYSVYSFLRSSVRHSSFSLSLLPYLCFLSAPPNSQSILFARSPYLSPPPPPSFPTCTFLVPSQTTNAPSFKSTNSQARKYHCSVFITLSCFLLPTILSKPLKAPDAINKILVVSTGMVSPRIFRELLSGTFTMVPSRILSNPYNEPTRRQWDKQWIVTPLLLFPRVSLGEIKSSGATRNKILKQLNYKNDLPVAGMKSETYKSLILLEKSRRASSSLTSLSNVFRNLSDLGVEKMPSVLTNDTEWWKTWGIFFSGHSAATL